MESLREAFREIVDTWVHAAKQSSDKAAWKAIVKAYLSPEHCEHPEHGCPLAALVPELARVDKKMRFGQDGKPELAPYLEEAISITLLGQRQA